MGRTDISPKKKYRWPINTWKDAQHRSLLEKCKSKLQWDITSHQSEWPSSKILQTINAGEGVEKREPSYVVGGNVNWPCHYAEEYGDALKKKTRNKITIRPSHFKFVYKNSLNQIIKVASVKHTLNKGLRTYELPERKHLICAVSLPDSGTKLLQTTGRHHPGYRSYHCVSPVVKYSLPLRVNESVLPGYWWGHVTSL